MQWQPSGRFISALLLTNDNEDSRARGAVRGECVTRGAKARNIVAESTLVVLDVVMSATHWRCLDLVLKVHSCVSLCHCSVSMTSPLYCFVCPSCDQVSK